MGKYLPLSVLLFFSTLVFSPREYLRNKDHLGNRYVLIRKFTVGKIYLNKFEEDFVILGFFILHSIYYCDSSVQ